MTIVSFSRLGIVLLVVAVIAAACLARRVRARRGARRIVEQWAREFIDHVDQGHPEHGEMPGDIFESDNNRSARHHAAYGRQRDVLANATNDHLTDLLGADDELKRTAARDELTRRGEHLSTQ